MSGRCGLGLAVVMVLLLGGLHTGAAAPRLVLTPARLAFDREGGSQVIRLGNRGDAPLQLKGLAFSADAAGFSAAPLLPQQLLPGAELAVTVHYARSGQRPQAFGALLVYSDDPGGFDDPRSEERDYVRGAALSAGATAATLGLWLPPLLAAGLLWGSRRLGRRWLRRWLLGLGLLTPLATSLWLVAHFDPGFTVPQGNYGVQLALHRTLWPALGLELWTGLDGLSLTLALLLAVAVALRLPGQWRQADPGAGWLLMLSGGAQLALCSLDAVAWLVGWELLLIGACGRLGGWTDGPAVARRAARRWLGAAQLAALLLGGALVVARGHSLATALADGTTVAHTTDLIKLGYGNYFGDVTLRGVPMERLLAVALLLGALLPGALLPALPTPLGERLLLSVPILVVGVAAVVRLSFYLLPQATVALAPWLVAAALAWGLGFTLRALRRRTLGELLVLALVARAGTVLLGLLSATQAGVQAALLQLAHYGLAATLLALGTPAEGERRPPARGAVIVAALLILDAPGLLGFAQRTLLILGIFPGLRVAAAVTTAASFALVWAALRLIQLGSPGLSPGDRAHREPDRTERLLVACLAILATGLGVWPQPLLNLAAGFVSDFISHVFTQLDASTVALLGR